MQACLASACLLKGPGSAWGPPARCSCIPAPILCLLCLGSSCSLNLLLPHLLMSDRQQPRWVSLLSSPSCFQAPHGEGSKWTTDGRLELGKRLLGSDTEDPCQLLGWAGLEIRKAISEGQGKESGGQAVSSLRPLSPAQ